MGGKYPTIGLEKYPKKVVKMDKVVEDDDDDAEEDFFNCGDNVHATRSS